MIAFFNLETVESEANWKCDENLLCLKRAESVISSFVSPITEEQLRRGIGSLLCFASVLGIASSDRIHSEYRFFFIWASQRSLSN